MLMNKFIFGMDIVLVNAETRHPALYRVIQAAMTKSDKSYLVYMAIRLLELHRILLAQRFDLSALRPNYESLFETDNNIWKKEFKKSDIVWCYKSGGASKHQFAKKHHIILFYAKNKGKSKFNVIKVKSYGKTGAGKAER